MADLPLLIDVRVTGHGQLRELSLALSGIAGATRITSSGLAKLAAPFKEAVALVAPLRKQTSLASKGLEELSGASVDASGKIRAVPPAVNKLLDVLSRMSSGAKVSADELREAVNAAYEASSPYKNLQSVIQGFVRALNIQKDSSDAAAARSQALKEHMAELNAAMLSISKTIGLSNSQIAKLVGPLTEAIAAVAPLKHETEMGKLGLEALAGATEDLQGKIAAVPPTVNTLLATLMKLATGGEVNMAKLIAQAMAAEEATTGYKTLHNIVAKVTELFQEQAITLGELSAAAREYTEAGGKFQLQTYETAKALKVSQSAAHGLMMGMGLLNGSILQVAFSIIFLRFSEVELSLATAATVVAFGGFVKILRAVVTRSVEAASSIEGLRRTLRAVAGSTTEANKMLDAIRRTSLQFGVAQSEVAQGFDRIREAGVANARMLEIVGIYARVTGQTYSEAATEIAQAVKGSADSLSVLSARQRASIEAMWEFRSAASRASWIINYMNKNYKEFGSTAAATTDELKTTIKEGFGAIWHVLGVGLNTIFGPIFKALAFLARLWGNAMHAIADNTAAAVGVTVVVFGVFGLAIVKVVRLLFKLWVAVLNVVKEIPHFVAQISRGAATLVTILGPALGMAADKADRLAISLRAVAAAAPGATAGAAATATAGTSAAGALGAMAAKGKGLAGIFGFLSKALGALGAAAMTVFGVLNAVQAEGGSAARVLYSLSAAASGAAVVLLAIPKVGWAASAALLVLSTVLSVVANIMESRMAPASKEAAEGLNKLGRVIGRSPGVAEDLSRLARRMSIAEVQTVEWREKLKGLASELRIVGRESRGIGGTRTLGATTKAGTTVPSEVSTKPGVNVEDWLRESIANPVFNFFTTTLPTSLAGIGTWLQDHIGQPLVNFFTVTLPGGVGKAIGWLWTSIGQPVVNFFTALPTMLGNLAGWLWSSIGSPVVTFFTAALPAKLGDIASWLWANIGSPVATFFISVLPAKLGDVTNWLWTNVGLPILNFFATTIPSALGGIGGWLWSHIGEPVLNFFTSTIPIKLAGIANWLWDNIGQPITAFFSLTLPTALAGLGAWLQESIGQPLKHFFTVTLPKGVGKITETLWANIGQPVADFFTTTLPTALGGLPSLLWASIGSPVADFFTVTLPAKLGGVANWLWMHIGLPVLDFFTTKIPVSFRGVGAWLWTHIGEPIHSFFVSVMPARLAWIADWLWRNIGQPVLNFFSSVLPNGLKGIGEWLHNTVCAPIVNFFAVTIPRVLSGIGGWLYSNIASPVINFFTKTLPSLPSTIWNALERCIIDPIRNFFGWISTKLTAIIPGFQKGGIVTSPIIAKVGEVPEAIIPLSKLKFGAGISVTVNISGNYILDDPTAHKLADRVTEQVMRTMNRYRPLPVTGVY